MLILKTVKLGKKNFKLIKKSIPVNSVQNGFLNFFDKERTFPTAAISASGPWIMGADQKIYYDAGGFGMLGFGHNPYEILITLSKPQVMANIMTPHYSQYTF